MKTELWNGYKISFVDVNGEWWAVAKDVADALGYAQTQNMLSLIPHKYLKSCVLHGMNSKSILIPEFGIYKAVFSSHKPEAEKFQKWVFNIIQCLRQETGLEGFEVFRMMDKEHQKAAMVKLNQALGHPKTVDYIKANTIADKAISNKYGLAKMIKKNKMNPNMLRDRQPILNDVVNLMDVKQRYNLDISVSEKIYDNVNG